MGLSELYGEMSRRSRRFVTVPKEVMPRIKVVPVIENAFDGCFIGYLIIGRVVVPCLGDGRGNVAVSEDDIDAVINAHD